MYDELAFARLLVAFHTNFSGVCLGALKAQAAGACVRSGAVHITRMKVAPWRSAAVVFSFCVGSPYQRLLRIIFFAHMGLCCCAPETPVRQVTSNIVIASAVYTPPGSSWTHRSQAYAMHVHVRCYHIYCTKRIYLSPTSGF